MQLTSSRLLPDLDGIVEQFTEALNDLKKVQLASRPMQDRLPAVPPDARIALEFEEGHGDGYVIDHDPCVMFRFVEGKIGIEIMVDDAAAEALTKARESFPEREHIGLCVRATLDEILEFNLSNVDEDELRQLAAKLDSMAQKVRDAIAAEPLAYDDR